MWWQDRRTRSGTSIGGSGLRIKIWFILAPTFFRIFVITPEKLIKEFKGWAPDEKGRFLRGVRTYGTDFK